MNIAQQVQQLIGNGRLGEVFQKYDHPELLLLASRYNGNERANNMGTMSGDEYRRTNTQITHAVLSLRADEWTLKGGSTTVVVANNITVNFGEQLKTVEGVQKMYARLQQRLENSELNAAEVKQASQSLYDLTSEDVFLDVISDVEKVERKRGDMDAAIATAVETLVSLEQEVIGFLRGQNQERKEKTLSQLLNDFSAAPSEATYEAFQKKATEVFASTAFYKPADRTALKALLNERPALNGFGFAMKVKGWVSRVNTWLGENYKA